MKYLSSAVGRKYDKSYKWNLSKIDAVIEIIEKNIINYTSNIVK